MKLGRCHAGVYATLVTWAAPADAREVSASITSPLLCCSSLTTTHVSPCTAQQTAVPPSKSNCSMLTTRLEVYYASHWAERRAHKLRRISAHVIRPKFRLIHMCRNDSSAQGTPSKGHSFEMCLAESPVQEADSPKNRVVY